MKTDLPRVSVIGLGKLGLPMAVALAAKGFPTIGVDIDSEKIKTLHQGVIPLYEPGLKELFAQSRERFTATGDYEKAIADSAITFILVPTPSNADGSFSLEYVLESTRLIAEALRKKSSYHLIVLSSTVLPGSIENHVVPLLAKHSGKSCGKDFGLCYNPEFVALGNVIKNLLNPDFILIGESDIHAGDTLANLYAHFVDNAAPAARMSFVNAELAKLAVNTFVTTKISFSNMLAAICEKLPGSDVDVVTSALGKDSRIGNKYLKGAIGYGGPCFPRDNLALIALARLIGAPAGLAEATDTFNRTILQRLKKIVLCYVPQGGRVGILGLAYKPDSEVVEQSQGLLLAQELIKEGISLTVYDPVALGDAGKILGNTATAAASAKECIATSDVIVVTTPWKEFSQLQSADFSRHPKPRVLVDCWRMFEYTQSDKGIIYVAIGKTHPARTV